MTSLYLLQALDGSLPELVLLGLVLLLGVLTFERFASE